jgi:hypothetical protein
MQAFVLAMAVFTADAAVLPYLGRWKLNVPKSDVRNIPVVVEQAPDGHIRTTALDGAPPVSSQSVPAGDEDEVEL